RICRKGGSTVLYVAGMWVARGGTPLVFEGRGEAQEHALRRLRACHPTLLCAVESRAVIIEFWAQFALQFFVVHPTVWPVQSEIPRQEGGGIGKADPTSLPRSPDQGGVPFTASAFLPSRGPFARHRPPAGELQYLVDP